MSRSPRPVLPPILVSIEPKSFFFLHNGPGSILRPHTVSVLRSIYCAQPCSRHWGRKESDIVPAPQDHIDYHQTVGSRLTQLTVQQKAVGKASIWLGILEGPWRRSGEWGQGVGWGIAGIVEEPLCPPQPTHHGSRSLPSSLSLSTYIRLLVFWEAFEVGLET